MNLDITVKKIIRQEPKLQLIIQEKNQKIEQKVWQLKKQQKIPLAGEVSWDLPSFKIDSVSLGISKSSKTIKEAAEKAILQTPSIAVKIKPLEILKKIFNVDLNIGASVEKSQKKKQLKIRIYKQNQQKR